MMQETTPVAAEEPMAGRISGACLFQAASCQTGFEQRCGKLALMSAGSDFMFVPLSGVLKQHFRWDMTAMCSDSSRGSF